MTSRQPWFFLLTIANLVAAAAAEEVEHPTYRSWASQPLGTSVTLRSTTVNAKTTLTTTTTTTLLKIVPEKLILESRVVSDATGRLVEVAPTTFEQPRMFPLFGDVKKEDVGKPVGAQTRGEEVLKLADREIKTIWFDSKGRGDAGETITRTWLSDEIPGRLVKAVTRIPRAGSTTTVELIAYRKP